MSFGGESMKKGQNVKGTGSKRNDQRKIEAERVN
jgi:hypothetical protein